MKKSVFFFFFFVIVLPVSRILYLNIVQKSFYQEKYLESTNVYVYGSSAPRGRILDCNGKVLVDNVGVPTIIYHKISGMTTKDEMELAHILNGYLNVGNASLQELKNYYVLLHEERAKSKISASEYQALEERKLTKEDITKFMYERITQEDLETLTEEEKKEAKIYALMQSGYSYEEKVLEKNVSYDTFAKLMELNLSGITGELTWERIYPYGDVLKRIFGSIGSISLEEKNDYLENGYALTDIVGTSYLEKEYESFLKGKKAKYFVEADKSLTKVEEEEAGSDLVISIDIDMQLGLKEIVQEYILKGKKSANTDLYKASYVGVMDSKTGSIKAIVGEEYVESKSNYVFTDVATDLFLKSFTPGSIVKAASMSVGYMNGLITPGRQIKDSCVKIYLNPEKCSFKSLGYVDDIRALKMSSNYYQFLLAIALTGQTYSYNMKFDVTEEDFLKYRSVFASYGLGSMTGIDLPKEEVGMQGAKISGDLLLNFAIGQYDTYTPLQILQYMNTVGLRGKRIAPSLMEKIVKPNGEVLIEHQVEVLGQVLMDDAYYDRIIEGLRQVIAGGTGNNYIDPKYQGAGKTGTSESFVDSDYDGAIDASTISSSFASFAPFDDPKYTFVVMSPHVVHLQKENTPMVYINKQLSRAVTDYVLQNY